MRSRHRPFVAALLLVACDSGSSQGAATDAGALWFDAMLPPPDASRAGGQEAGTRDASAPASDASADGAVMDALGRDAGLWPVIPPGPPVTVSTGADRQIAMALGPYYLTAGNLMFWRYGESAPKLVRKGPYRSVAANSLDYVCTLGMDGALLCDAAEAESGQLCAHDPSCAPKGLPPSGHFLDLSVYGERACAVRDTGALVCWGRDFIGSGPVLPTASDFTAVTMGDGFACGLRAQGSVACWGWLTGSLTEAPFEGRVVREVQAGGNWVCALFDTGRLACEGSWTPASTGDLTQAQDIAHFTAAPGGLCTLDAAGTARCMGEPGLARVTPHAGPFRDIATGSMATCGLRGDDVVQCWGVGFGNGAGGERCDVGEARLTRDAEPVSVARIATRTLENRALSESAGWDQRAAGSMGLYLREHPEGVFSVLPGRMLLSAQGGTSPSDLADGASLELGAGYWMSEATTAASGELLCIPDGTGSRIARHGDELNLSLQGATRLPGCPGRPLSGTLEIGQDDHIPRGSVGGVPWSSTMLSWAYSDNDVATLELEDRTIIQLTVDGQTSTSQRWGSPGGGRIYPSYASVYAGEVLCFGASGYAKASDGQDVLRLESISTLGPCPRGGDATLAGCAR